MNAHKRDMVIMEKITAHCENIMDAVARFGDGYDIFIADKHFQLCCTMSILQIGELCKRLSDDFQASHTDMPWREFGNIRNYFAHDYDNVEMDGVWDTIKKDIPALSAYCGSVIAGHRMANYDVFVELEPAAGGPGEGGCVPDACDDRDMTM